MNLLHILRRLSLAAVVLAGVPLLLSCYHGVDDDDPLWTHAEPTARLVVRTRAASSEGDVSYPVTVYIFRDGFCYSRLTLADEATPLSTMLPAGPYDLYAVAGATTTSYILPGTDETTPSSLVELRDGARHADLMTADGYVQLADGEENTLTLSMTRRVMELSSVTIRELPAEATAVTFEVGPLYAALALDGAYGDDYVSHSIALDRQADGTWQTAEPVFLLPSIGHATFKLSVTLPSGVRSYTYGCDEGLDPNHRFTVTGTYAPNTGLTLSGLITGATWGDDRTITFDFDDSGTTGGYTPPTTPVLPAAGEEYKGCYVLSSDGSTAVLLSPKCNPDAFKDVIMQGNVEQIKAILDEELPSWTPAIEGLTWRLPTEDEAKMIVAQSEAINEVEGFNLSTGLNYCCIRNNKFYSFSLVQAEWPCSDKAREGDALIAVADLQAK